MINRSQSSDERKNIQEAYSCISIVGRAGSERIVTYNSATNYWSEYPVKRYGNVFDGYDYEVDQEKV